MSAGVIRRCVPALAVALFVIGGFLRGRFSDGFDAGAATAVPFLGPSAEHLLGTDKLGRDVLDRLLVGGAGLLAVALVLAAAVTALGAVLGALAALRPAADAGLRWLTDGAVLIPAVLAMLVLGAALPDAGFTAIGIAGVVLGTPYAAKVFQSAAAVAVMNGHVEAAEGIGESLPRLIFAEVLPMLRQTIIAVFGLRLVEATYLVSTAAFLHIPTGLAETNWAQSVRDNGAGLLLNPWAALAPALAIAAASIAVLAATRGQPGSGRAEVGG
ncbi:ABC transporter permease subunit [Corynebacterium hansenii]|uniref:ABC transporter permease subunit n=1 Tax=Corynebacterium hansenii TaxID=394964 RepID=A0ABV7ZP80_9CORY|nr:ABC transporter permease subunit [Corynebacterium hansenii]WJY98912.1 putative D,D-dipeptide transport system permease protein DdpC [Corynebacterium hansenii]